MKYMKKKKTVAAAAAAVVGLIVGLSAVTLGFLGDSVGIGNKFTIGHNKSKVDEITDNYNQTTGDKTYTKEVRVQNEDNVPCFVRVYMDFSNSAAEDKCEFSNDEKGDSAVFHSNDAYRSELAAATNTTAEKWIYVSHADDSLLGGYFYYIIPVDPGESTDTLIKQVKIKNGDNADAIKDFNILVYSETVRSDEKAPDWSKLSDEEKEAWAIKAKTAWESFLNVTSS
ncbi:MAG: hypothetical protein J6A07_07725 [Firmicutes bacterium]|nr:hypothetical protein [Bacillota bacterium]